MAVAVPRNEPQPSELSVSMCWMELIEKQFNELLRFGILWFLTYCKFQSENSSAFLSKLISTTLFNGHLCKAKDPMWDVLCLLLLRCECMKTVIVFPFGMIHPPEHFDGVSPLPALEHPLW